MQDAVRLSVVEQKCYNYIYIASYTVNCREIYFV